MEKAPTLKELLQHRKKDYANGWRFLPDSKGGY